MNLVAIKYKICFKAPTPSTGVMDYPNLNVLPAGVRNGLPWTNYIDQFGGPHYDKVSGFGVGDDENPDALCQYCAALVEPAFALVARETFPERVWMMRESEFEKFYDNRAHRHEPGETIHSATITGLRAKYGVPDGKMLVADETWNKHDAEAIDDQHPSPGLIQNQKKTYQQLKKLMGFTYDKHEPIKETQADDSGA